MPAGIPNGPIPVGTTIKNGWLVASPTTHEVDGVRSRGVIAFCPLCGHPERVDSKTPPMRCALCARGRGQQGRKKVQVSPDPERRRAAVSEAYTAFGEDFRYAEEIAEWAVMIEAGRELQRSRTENPLQ